MSTTYIANIVSLLGILLPIIGVHLPPDEILTTITNLIAIGAGIWIFVGRWRAGGITWYGAKPVKNI